jgi:hypothetical protein
MQMHFQGSAPDKIPPSLLMYETFLLVALVKPDFQWQLITSSS